MVERAWYGSWYLILVPKKLLLQFALSDARYQIQKYLLCVIVKPFSIAQMKKVVFLIYANEVIQNSQSSRVNQLGNSASSILQSISPRTSDAGRIIT